MDVISSCASRFCFFKQPWECVPILCLSENHHIWSCNHISETSDPNGSVSEESRLVGWFASSDYLYTDLGALRPKRWSQSVWEFWMVAARYNIKPLLRRKYFISPNLIIKRKKYGVIRDMMASWWWECLNVDMTVSTIGPLGKECTFSAAVKQSGGKWELQLPINHCNCRGATKWQSLRNSGCDEF